MTSQSESDRSDEHGETEDADEAHKTVCHKALTTWMEFSTRGSYPMLIFLQEPFPGNLDDAKGRLFPIPLTQEEEYEESSGEDGADPGADDSIPNELTAARKEPGVKDFCFEGLFVWKPCMERPGFLCLEAGWLAQELADSADSEG